MALMPSEQKSNITVSQKILAQSAANKTLGEQLTELQTAYNQLTIAQKNRVWIQVGTQKYLSFNPNSYLSVYLTSAHLIIGEFFMSTATARRSRDGGVPTDVTSETDTSVMYLVIEDDNIS